MSDMTASAYPDRVGEFMLVRSLREYVKLTAQRISEATRKDYTEKYIRMRRTGFLPECAGTKRAFYAYRAALLYGAAEEAKAALRARDRAEYGSESWKSAVCDLERLAKIFERYPPDPDRKHYATGSPSFTWSEVCQQSTSSAPKQAARGSKKRVLSKVRKIAGWREMLFKCIRRYNGMLWMRGS